MLAYLLLSVLLATVLPSSTHCQSQSVPGPSPVVAHFPFDIDYTSQFNSYTSFSPSTSSYGPPPIVYNQSNVACPFGGCASFTDRHYLDVSPYLPMLGVQDGQALSSWSVALWVKAEASGYQALLGQWGEGSYVWSLRLVNYQPQLIWIFRNAQHTGSEVVWTSAKTVSNARWTHIVANYNHTANTFQFWQNGQLTDTWHSGAAYTFLLSGAPALGWKVGLIDDTSFGLQGALDELWVFSDALSSDEVLLLHAINSIGSCAPGTAGVAQYRVGTCTTCPSGTFATQIGALVCSVCPAGTSSQNGSSACQACDSGTFSTAGSDACYPSPAGFFAPAPGTALYLPCAAGSYSNLGANTCSYCPPNTLAPPQSTSASNCTACPAGSSGGGIFPVCCARGVSPAGALLASTSVALSNYGVQNTCLLNANVMQSEGNDVVEYLSQYCGDGYDTTATAGLQDIYGQFSAFQSTAGTAALQQIYCNP